MRLTYDSRANCADAYIAPEVATGEAVEQVVVERKGGTVVLDFSDDGRLLGVELIGAKALLGAAALSTAERI